MNITKYIEGLKKNSNNSIIIFIKIEKNLSFILSGYIYLFKRTYFLVLNKYYFWY